MTVERLNSIMLACWISAPLLHLAGYWMAAGIVGGVSIVLLVILAIELL